MLGQGAGLGVLEQAMRAALTAAGARLLEAVLAGETGYQRSAGRAAAAAAQAAYAGCRPKTVTTVLGPVPVTPGVVSLRAVRSRIRAPGRAAGRGRNLAVAGPGRDDRPGRGGSPVRQAPPRCWQTSPGSPMNAKTIERAAEAAGAAARAAGDC